MKPLEVGGRVSVVMTNGMVRPATITTVGLSGRAKNGGLVELVRVKFLGNREGHLHVLREGITWCRGWRGKAVEALKVSAALME